MYTVKGDGIVIYSDVSVAENQKAINPTLNLVDNAAGSLSITLPPGNDGYNTLNRLSSEIVVYNDGKELWSGRILSEDRDFNNNRILTCEGELAYLQDSIQPQKKFEEGTTVEFSLNTFLTSTTKSSQMNDINSMRINRTYTTTTSLFLR